MAFWTISRTARLFEDRQYGQWGLEILSPMNAAGYTQQQYTNRSSQFREGDLVVGRFLGDSDLLVVRCDQDADDFKRVLIALPIDPRSEWYVASETFGDFGGDAIHLLTD